MIAKELLFYGFPEKLTFATKDVQGHSREVIYYRADSLQTIRCRVGDLASLKRDEQEEKETE